MSHESGGVQHTSVLMCPHKKKSKVHTSGERKDHSNAPVRLIQRPRNLYLNNFVSNFEIDLTSISQLIHYLTLFRIMK